jgi:hypothetical protein
MHGALAAPVNASHAWRQPRCGRRSTALRRESVSQRRMAAHLRTHVCSGLRRLHGSCRLCRGAAPVTWPVFRELEMRSTLVIVPAIRREHAPEMRFVQDDMRSSHSRRIEPITRSTYGFCKGPSQAIATLHSTRAPRVCLLSRLPLHHRDSGCSVHSTDRRRRLCDRSFAHQRARSRQPPLVIGRSPGGPLCHPRHPVVRALAD